MCVFLSFILICYYFHFFTGDEYKFICFSHCVCLCRPEDLRVPFERFGPVRDVYLPRNYHTGYALFEFYAHDLKDPSNISSGSFIFFLHWEKYAPSKLLQ